MDAVERLVDELERSYEEAQRMVASPALIARLPSAVNPADLASLPSLGLGPLNRDHVWKLAGPDEALVRIPDRPRQRKPNCLCSPLATHCIPKR